MKTIFDKSNLPFLQRFADQRATPRDHWTLARFIQSNQGFVCNETTMMLLLTQGAQGGDPWSMCELARLWYEQGDSGLPIAMHWWNKAVALKDAGATWDVENRPIEGAIHAYAAGPTEYANIEMRCALLTAWILTRLGRDRWEQLSDQDRENRITQLVQVASTHLHIQAPRVLVKADCTLDGRVIDGAASYQDRTLWLRKDCVSDLHRLVQVIFHELGHFVVFSMWQGDRPDQQERFGITDERIRGWHTGTMGLHVPMGEEDPDSLSYGVYTNWLVYFGSYYSGN